MYIFAHLFAGALLGLGFWYLTNDRRAVPVCVIASVLPDVIDKSLGFLFPLDLGSGRTVFHSLLIILVILLGTVILVRPGHRWLGLVLGATCAILLHQVFDEMWLLPANWFYPLLGPFQGSMIPEYIGVYFWREITNPSEWMFLVASVAIFLESYRDMLPTPRASRTDTLQAGVYSLVVAGLLITGLYLLVTGLTSTTTTFLTPLYHQEQTIVTGVLALCGAVIMHRETYAAVRRE